MRKAMKKKEKEHEEDEAAEEGTQSPKPPFDKHLTNLCLLWNILVSVLVVHC